MYFNAEIFGFAKHIMKNLRVFHLKDYKIGYTQGLPDKSDHFVLP